MSLSPSIDFGCFGSGSPNLTIGSVSSMAFAMPLARLRLGLPMMFRGPYLSGWRRALMAPPMMTMRSSTVMMLVSAYKMIIAEARVLVSDYRRRQRLLRLTYRTTLPWRMYFSPGWKRRDIRDDLYNPQAVVVQFKLRYLLCLSLVGDGEKVEPPCHSQSIGNVAMSMKLRVQDCG